MRKGMKSGGDEDGEHGGKEDAEDEGKANENWSHAV